MHGEAKHRQGKRPGNLSRIGERVNVDVIVTAGTDSTHQRSSVGQLPMHLKDNTFSSTWAAMSLIGQCALVGLGRRQ